MISIINRDRFVCILQSQTELMSCPTESSGETIECKQLPFPCIKCSFNLSCIYGKEQMVTCNVANPHVVCNVSLNIEFLPSSFRGRRQCVLKWCSNFKKWSLIIILMYFQGPKEFQRSMICRYCWQTETWEHTCVLKDGCNSANQIYLYVLNIIFSDFLRILHT